MSRARVMCAAGVLALLAGTVNPAGFQKLPPEIIRYAPFLKVDNRLLAMHSETPASSMAQGVAIRDDEFLPPGDARRLVRERCGVCHGLVGFIGVRKTRTEWESTVMDMVSRGASLEPEEEEQVIAYLSAVFGAAAPPLTDVNVAAPEDLIKLPGITPALAAQLVAHRTTSGPFTSRDEVQALTDLEDDAFEKIKWYIRAVAGSPAH